MDVHVLTLNIWHGFMLDADIDFIHRQDPDILLLQEVYNGSGDVPASFRSFEALQQKLSHTASDFAPSIIDVREEGKFPWGNAIFSKYPIITRDVHFFDGKLTEFDTRDPAVFATITRCLQHVRLDTPAGEVNVYNFQGVWDLDGDSYSDLRRLMSEVIIREIKDKPHVILGGDTNAKPTNKSMTDIEKYLHSVFGNELKSTFNMKHKDNPGYATASVDMIFVSKNIKVLERTCHDDDVSDHLALSANLRIPKD